jgi:hypothetical protein
MVAPSRENAFDILSIRISEMLRIIAARERVERFSWCALSLS